MPYLHSEGKLYQAPANIRRRCSPAFDLTQVPPVRHSCSRHRVRYRRQSSWLDTLLPRCILAPACSVASKGTDPNGRSDLASRLCKSSRRADCMQLACERAPGSPSDSCAAVVMHFDVAAASCTPRPGPDSPTERASQNLSAPGSPSGGPPRTGPTRDESTKTKEFCKVRQPATPSGCQWQQNWVMQRLPCAGLAARRMAGSIKQRPCEFSVSDMFELMMLAASMSHTGNFATCKLAWPLKPSRWRLHGPGGRLLAESAEREDILPAVSRVPLPCAR